MAEVTGIRAIRWKRDKSIVTMVRKGVLKIEVARQFGVAATTITHILDKHAPELKRRVSRGR